MSQVFAFYENDKLRFRCELEKRQCEYTTSTTKTRCKNTVSLALPYCPLHLKRQLYLRIAPSTVDPDIKGVFAIHPDEPLGRKVKVFTKGDTVLQQEPIFDENTTIGQYFGEIVTEAEIDRRYGDFTAPYSIQRGPDEYIDAACVRSVVSMINHKPKAKGANVEFITNTETNNVEVVALKDIYSGTELFVDYGEKFRLHEPGARHYTGCGSSPERFYAQ